MAALQGIKSEVLDKLADKMDSNETDHLLMLQVMGVDSITEHYIQTLLDKYGFDILDPNEIPELEGIPIPDINKDEGIIVNPIPEPGNDEQSVGFPIQSSDKDDGIFAGPKVTTGHWGDLLITQDVADLINSSEKGRET